MYFCRWVNYWYNIFFSFCMFFIGKVGLSFNQDINNIIVWSLKYSCKKRSSRSHLHFFEDFNNGFCVFGLLMAEPKGIERRHWQSRDEIWCHRCDRTSSEHPLSRLPTGSLIPALGLFFQNPSFVSSKNLGFVKTFLILLIPPPPPTCFTTWCNCESPAKDLRCQGS